MDVGEHDLSARKIVLELGNDGIRVHDIVVDF